MCVPGPRLYKKPLKTNYLLTLVRTLFAPAEEQTHTDCFVLAFCRVDFSHQLHFSHNRSETNGVEQLQEATHRRSGWPLLGKFQDSAFCTGSAAMPRRPGLHAPLTSAFFIAFYQHWGFQPHFPPIPLPSDIICVGTCFTQDLNWWVSVRGPSRAAMEQDLVQSISILCLEQTFEWRDPESFLESSQYWAKRSKITSNQNCQRSSSGCYTSQDRALSLQYGPQWPQDRATR